MSVLRERHAIDSAQLNRGRISRSDLATKALVYIRPYLGSYDQPADGNAPICVHDGYMIYDDVFGDPVETSHFPVTVVGDPVRAGSAQSEYMANLIDGRWMVRTGRRIAIAVTVNFATYGFGTYYLYYYTGDPPADTDANDRLGTVVQAISSTVLVNTYTTTLTPDDIGLTRKYRTKLVQANGIFQAGHVHYAESDPIAYGTYNAVSITAA